MEGAAQLYQYFNGLVIREGTEGIPADFVEALFKDAGWQKIFHRGKKKNTHLFLKIQLGHLPFGIMRE